MTFRRDARAEMAADNNVPWAPLYGCRAFHSRSNSAILLDVYNVMYTHLESHARYANECPDACMTIAVMDACNRVDYIQIR